MKNQLAVYQIEQIRELEKISSARFAISAEALMARAGKAAFEFLVRRFTQVKRVKVFCGGGNNGGDGYVLAQHAHEHGLHVEIVQVGDASKLSKEAAAALTKCQQANISIIKFKDKLDLQHTDVIVDAICGIGARENMRDEVLSAIENINHAGVPVLALDIPTGVNADTGSLLGAVINATATITFIGMKLGLITSEAVSYAGDVVVNDLQLTNNIFECVAPIAQKIELANYQSYLKPRTKNWHKGKSGHVLIVGGADGFSGAARMAGMAALRVGAGLVSIATDVNNATVMNADCPELMCHGIAKADEIMPLMAKATIIIIGPGLGLSPWAQALWSNVLSADLPLVVDADALNLLASQPAMRDNWVLTPHPGEAGRLLKEPTEKVQQNRLRASVELSKRYGGVVVLKGAGTLVSATDTLTGVCDKGNPGMATAGMGDILSGVIGGLLAQGMSLEVAAKLGVVMHATAGDFAAKDGERGMIATDLLPYLHRLGNL